MMSAIALVRDGGYSLSCDVLKTVFPFESLVVPIVNCCCLMGLWQV